MAIMAHLQGKGNPVTPSALIFMLSLKRAYVQWYCCTDNIIAEQSLFFHYFAVTDG
jgi:hypothetical protein